MSLQDNSPAADSPESFALACGMSDPVEIHTTHRATGATQSYRIAQPFVFVGRAKSMGVRLDDPSISQCHAYLQVVGGVPYCIDLGSRTGVAWDDGGQGRGWVKPGQTLRVGAFDVRIGGPEANPAPPSGPGGEGDHPPVLEVYAPEGGPARSHALDQPVTLVGRHPNCDLRLLGDAAPYFQCSLVGTPDGVWCVDIWSTRGTLVNGRSVRLARVRDGDLIEVGRVSLVVRTGTGGSRPLVLNSATDAPADEALAAIPQKVAESVTGAFAPFREVMEHYKQCLTNMTQMLAAMQQEHASMLGEQTRQVQELTQELRQLRADVEREGAAARSLAATQKEHAAAVGERVQQVQELTRELRADIGRMTVAPQAPAIPPAVEPAPPPTAAAPPPPPPAPRVSQAQPPVDAQTWSLDRLAMTIQPQFGTLVRAGKVQQAGPAQAEEGVEKPAREAEAERVGGPSAERRLAEIEMGNEILTSVLNERRVKLGPDHPDTLATLDDLAQGYRDAGQWDKALPLLEESLRLRTARLGPDHPDTLTATGNLAAAYLGAKQVDRWLSALEGYVPKMRVHLGADTPRFAGLLALVSYDLLAARQYAVAESHLRECLAVLEGRQPDAWITSQARSLLGGSLLGQKKYADAEPLLLTGYQGMKRLEKTVPPQGQALLREAANRLVELYTAAGKPEEAARWRAEGAIPAGAAPAAQAV